MMYTSETKRGVNDTKWRIIISQRPRRSVCSSVRPRRSSRGDICLIAPRRVHLIVVIWTLVIFHQIIDFIVVLRFGFLSFLFILLLFFLLVVKLFCGRRLADGRNVLSLFTQFVQPALMGLFSFC